MTEKIITAAMGVIVGSLFTWSTKATLLEGRMDAIERGIVRIEAKLERLQ